MTYYYLRQVTMILGKRLMAIVKGIIETRVYKL
jgi:hypothetical protein